MTTPRHTVVFFQGEARWTIEVADGDSLLQAAPASEAPVHTLCNGIGACVQCKVRVAQGMANLTPPNTLERDRLGNIFHITQERLACQSRVHGDCEVEALPVRMSKKRGGLPPPRGGDTPPRGR